MKLLRCCSVLGVFGSQAYEASEYILQIYRVVDENYNPEDLSSAKYSDIKSTYNSPSADSASHSDDGSFSLVSIIWEVMEFLLKIFVEILL